MGTYDVRAVANEVLDEAFRSKRLVTHLSLQKICFFAHGMYLAHSGSDLVRGEFEAWNYGPVHRVLYHALQTFKDRPIVEHISRIDPITGDRCGVPKIGERADAKFVQNIAAFFLGFNASQLVELSHAGGSPWSQVWKSAEEKPNIGMRIPNSIVGEFYRGVELKN